MRPVQVVRTDDVAATGATVIAAALRHALVGRERASCAVSGGRTPWAMFDRLVTEALAWDRVDVYQVDERVAPPGAAERNLTHLRAGLGARTGAVLHPMPVDAADLDAAAARYASALPDVFDVVHLGLGADGHTASLVPGDPVLDVTERAVAVTGVYGWHRRMTLTYPVLDRARRIVWLVSGPDKGPALARLLAGDPAIPAGRVCRDRAVVVTDLELPDPDEGGHR